MRFIRIEVESFQGIERASVDFGPGLNVFYGRNDLGKSTLVRAIRAALLTPSSSAETRTFLPWHRDASPRVQLTFQQNDGKYWRIDKTFGDGNRADLSFSKDGVTFVSDAKAREVDERLRTMLEWGVPSPGGRGGPKKLSPSFLMRVLLPDQDDVDQILGAGLDSDPDESGRKRLTAVLAALAEDPTFKRVLEAAIQESGRYFTDTGRRKTGAGTELVAASTEVKKRKTQLDEYDALVTQSESTERHLATLLKQIEDEKELLAEAEAAIAALEARKARLLKREGLEKDQREAAEILRRIDERLNELREVEKQVSDLEQRRTTTEATLQDAARLLQTRTDEVTAAEKAFAEAGDAGAQRRDRRRTELSVALSELRSRVADIERRRDRVAQALKLQQELNEARRIKQAVDAELSFSLRQQAGAGEQRKTAEKEVATATGLRSYGLWRQASDATKNMGRFTAEAAALRSRANAADQQANELDSARVPGLPDRSELAQLQKLGQELAVAEARLGGGLSIQIRPLKPIALSVSKDGESASESVQKEPISVDADRQAQVRIGDLVTIEVQAGAPETRQQARLARERWTLEAEPLLNGLGVSDLDALSALCRSAEEVVVSITRLRGEAASSRQQAQEREGRAAELVERAAQEAERWRALADHDKGELERLFATLGTGWESQADAQLQTREQVRQSKLKAEQDAAVQVATKTSRAQEAAARVTRAEESLREAAGQIGIEDPQGAARQIETELAEVKRQESALDTELKGLDAATKDELAGFQLRVDEAKARLLAAKTGHSSAAGLFEQSRERLHTGSGRRDQLRLDCAQLDRLAAETTLKERSARLAEVPAEPAVGEAALAAARTRRDGLLKTVAEIGEQLRKAQWELETSGGSVARERRQQAKEAWEKAYQAELALEAEAESWKLLKETLREVENEEGTHLGRALATPVNARFAELTSGRYAHLKLGPNLKADGIEVAGGTSGEDILEGLSVGRKDQLATVLRLTIAEQLRSAIVLDDHLAHTDGIGLEWFRAALHRAAATTQIIVITCRPSDYLGTDATVVQPGPTFQSVDLEQAIRSWRAGSEVLKAAVGS